MTVRRNQYAQRRDVAVSHVKSQRLKKSRAGKVSSSHKEGRPPSSGLTKKQRQQARRLKNLRSLFKDDVTEIASLLEDQQTESAVNRFQRTMLKSLMDLIPIAEDKYRQEGSERAAYALNSLVSQARELIADMQAERDGRQLALQLSSEIIDPAFIGIAQVVIDSLHNLKRSLETYVPEHRHPQLNNLARESAGTIARYIESQRGHIKEKMVESME